MPTVPENTIFEGIRLARIRGCFLSYLKQKKKVLWLSCNREDHFIILKQTVYKIK